MRYFIRGKALFIRGLFRAVSTGSTGGIRDATTIVYLPEEERSGDEMMLPVMNEGMSLESTIGLINPAGCHISVMRYNLTRVFIAGKKADENRPSCISIIAVLPGKLHDRDLLHMLLISSGAAERALEELGCHDLILELIVTADLSSRAEYSEEALSEAVRYGVHQAIAHESEETGFSFYIHSMISQSRWIEWIPGPCPYYPCHFTGQSCELCYCPLYPCRDESLGEWVESRSSTGHVWSCAPCTLNHQPAVVAHLKRNPEASLQELKSLLAGKEKKDRKM